MIGKNHVIPTTEGEKLEQRKRTSSRRPVKSYQNRTLKCVTSLISDKVNIREIVEGHRVVVVVKINVIIPVDKYHNSVSRLVRWSPSLQITSSNICSKLAGTVVIQPAFYIFFFFPPGFREFLAFNWSRSFAERKLRKEWMEPETVTPEKLKSRKFMTIIPFRAFSFRSKRIRVSFVTAACALTRSSSFGA